MNDPWQTLILDPNTATEKDVKAAYARLLKQHRPDTDPQGFQRVREAYELALGAVRERDAGGMIPELLSTGTLGHGGPEVTESAAGEADLPESLAAPVQQACAELERATSSEDVPRLEAALMGFLEECEKAGVDDITRVRLLEKSCAGNVKLLAAAVPNRFLLRLAELGQVHLPHLVLSAWSEEERRERIMQFGQALVDDATALATPEGSVLMARVAVLIGLEAPTLATSLGNISYPHLPLDSRGQIMAQVEQETALGRLFNGVSLSMKSFWFERLRNANEPHDWRSTESLRAIDDLVNHKRYMWEGWGIVQQLMPPESWTQVESRLRNQAKQVADNTPRRSSFPGWLVIPMVILGLNFFRFISSETSKPSSYSRPQSYRQLEEAGVFYDPQRDAVLRSVRDSASQQIHRPIETKSPTEFRMPNLSSQQNTGVLTIPEVSGVTPVLPVISPQGAAPSPPSSTTSEKKTSDSDAYLRSIQNGSLFDKSSTNRPPPPR